MILEATALGLGSCLVGGFHDDTVSQLLEIDGVNEAPLLPVVVGKIASGEPAARNGQGSW
jgi:nitroreductase